MKKKFTDNDLIILNNIGLTTSTIAKILGVNQSAIYPRLKKLGLQAFYPRGKSKSFMEDVFFELSIEEKGFLAEKAQNNVKNYIINLIKKDYADTYSKGSDSGSAELPVSEQ